MYVVSESQYVQNTSEMKNGADRSRQKEAMNLRNIFSTLSLAMLTAGLLAISGCSVSRVPESFITVEGVVTIRGNEPFMATVLQTQNRNDYILKLSPDERSLLITPARFRVRVCSYLDGWNRRNCVHMMSPNCSA